MVEEVNGRIGFIWCEPVNFFCDNKTAISISKNPIQHNRARQVEVDKQKKI